MNVEYQVQSGHLEQRSFSKKRVGTAICTIEQPMDFLQRILSLPFIPLGVLKRGIRRVSSSIPFLIISIVVLFPALVDARGFGRRQPNPCPARQCVIRPQDQIWKISTRHLGPCGDACSLHAPPLNYQRYDQCRGWVASSLEEFMASDGQGMLTTVYVHGNRMSPEWTVDHGFKVYCMLTCDQSSQQPQRMVIWSWPSEEIPQKRRIVKDVRIKATRTDMQSYYFGWWLSQLQPDQQVSVLGYSYGARTVLGALHMLSGGQLAGRSLPGSAFPQTVRPRIVLWAAAAQANWIVPGNRYGRAVDSIEQGLVALNRRDPVLRRYQRCMSEANGPAMGFVGVVGEQCIPGSGKLTELEVTQDVGNRHASQKYFDSCQIGWNTRRYMLWHPIH